MPMKDVEMRGGSDEDSDTDDAQPIYRGSTNGEMISKKTHRMIVVCIILLVALPLFISTVVLATENKNSTGALTTITDEGRFSR